MNTLSKRLLVGLGVCACAVGIAQTQESESNTADQEAIVQKWMEFATPGAEHELLKYKEGKWTAHVETWLAPDTEPSVSEGTSETKLILGGRYLLDNTKTNFNNMPFEGLGIVAYDNLLKQFVSVWIDNMGTGVMQGTGTYDEATKTYTYEMTAPDVMAGKYKKGRMIERILNDDQWVMEMYDTTPDGKEFVTMKGTYTRVK